MNLLFFFDLASTGFPAWQDPSDAPHQPHLVQIGAMLVDPATGNVVQSMDVVIKPDGWEIPEQASSVHGITTEMALELGIPEKEAIEQFLAMRSNYPRVSFGKSFDHRLIRIATKRYCSQDQIDEWGEKDDYSCAIALAKPFVQVPNASGKGIKNPNLRQALEHFTGKTLEVGCSAMDEALACKDIYFAAK
jgi:DNA polymerase-3 subunit epsilon